MPQARGVDGGHLVRSRLSGAARAAQYGRRTPLACMGRAHSEGPRGGGVGTPRGKTKTHEGQTEEEKDRLWLRTKPPTDGSRGGAVGAAAMS
jgi:hypothetical protein